MLLKIYLIMSMTLLALANNSIETEAEPSIKIPVKFETSHKQPLTNVEEDFQTSHKISPYYLSSFTSNDNGDFGGLRFLRSLLPTKERPELNPVLSALINEDVMKSIEAKRAIEEDKLEQSESVIEKRQNKANSDILALDKSDDIVEEVTEVPNLALTTTIPIKKLDFDDDINVGFVDQTISLDAAGTEQNKKSRIEIKKGPNGQDYEYEYVYYYEDEDEEGNKSKNAAAAATDTDTDETNARGKSRYSSIDRNSNAQPTENSLVSGKAKGRASNTVIDDIEPERLPTNTRFPSRSKNIDVPPTPPLDTVQNVSEKKKIGVKRPSLELVDSQTFNTDEKQAKRNGDTEVEKSAMEKEQIAAAAALEEAGLEKNANNAESVTIKNELESNADVVQTTPPMEKAALDLYAILTNENLNNDMTTDSNDLVTTSLPDTTNADSEENLTTLEDLPASSTTTTTTTTSTTTTTTTEAPTTTTTTAQPSLFSGRRPGLAVGGGRNRFKPKGGHANAGASSTTTTTEAAAAAEQPKTGRNRFSRPSIGGRTRPGGRTTPAPAPASEEEEKIEAKEVKPVSSGFGRNKPRNRYNSRGTTTTEKAIDESDNNAHEETISSTTARGLRVRPTLNLRGRGRSTTTKAPAAEDESAKESDTEGETKQAAPASSNKPSRFSLNRPGGNRLLPRGKFGRTTEAPVSEDSAADSSHHNDIKGGDENEAETEKTEHKEETPAPTSGLNRLKNRPRLNLKTESVKSKANSVSVAPRKVNPLLAKRRLQLGPSTTEAAPVEEDASDAATSDSEEASSKESTSSTADDTDSPKEDTTEDIETTTKQARGLGLLGQRRRLPLRKPGTIL